MYSWSGGTGTIVGVEGSYNSFVSFGQPGLQGSEMIDRFTGGSDNDVFLGNGGNDILIGNGDRDLIRGGDGNDIIRGGTGEDDLRGDDGNDQIFGGNHNDFIVGGSGNDILFGNAGNDIFDMNVGDGQDRIGDFSNGADRLDLRDFNFSSFGAINATQSSTDVLIDLGNGDSITLVNFLLGSFDSTDVLI